MQDVAAKRALVQEMVEMAMDGVPTKKVTRITEVVGISQVHEVIAVWDQDQE